MKNNLKKPVFLLAALFGIALLVFGYAEHFHNPFQFDDSHTIENNVYIRDIKNIPLFFDSAATTSTLPSNQAYRPGLTTLNAIDTWIGGKPEPDPFYFHVHIFISYILLGILLFFFFLHVFEKASPGRAMNHWLSLLATTWFWVHAANAETINYVISRSDSASTFWIMLTFITYLYSEKTRKYLLFLVPMLAGFFIKEPALMFAPLLLVYEVLFGKISARKIVTIILVFGFAGALFLFSRAKTPAMWTSGGYDQVSYMLTQPFVFIHYFNNFILPLNLAADTDWGLIKNPTDDRVIIGVLFILLLLFIAWRSSRTQKAKPIAFGILWFFIALAPTSSIFPFAEVLNDHRVFFPYIGLVLAFTCATGLLLENMIERYKTKRSESQLPVYLFSFLAFVFLFAHTLGTRERCQVWSSGYSLWKDCAEKCPKNGRGLMNYANEVVALGRKAIADNNKPKADSLFHVADSVYAIAQKEWPDYSYIYINVAVLREWQGNLPEAEKNFKKAIELRADNPECYYFLADFYVRRDRAGEAPPFIQSGLNLSPAHEGLNRLKSILDKGVISINPVEMARLTAQNTPTPENYLNLSLAYYNANLFAQCVEAAEQALKLRPGYVEAYNNICSAWNKLGEWDKAAEAGAKGLQLKPDYEMLQNNVRVAAANKATYEKQEAGLQANPTAEGYLQFSLQYYNSGIFNKCISMAEKALTIKPDYADAYNNICAAANMTGDFDKAIAAGESALRINPNYELAKNNLAEALRRKQAQGKTP
ncbi:MAG: hypothetical protein FD123_1525 [Bacteroidetes bacterium]|nr:MAG: hypothetical protein FD123_1525 [Bacteroidota bacterium]